MLHFLLLPAAGAAVDVYLITQLGGTAVKLGLGWLVIGVCWLAVLTKGFRAPAPSLSLDEGGADAAPLAAEADPVAG